MILVTRAIVILIMVLFFALIYKKIVKPLIMRSRLIKQGVVFLKNPILGELNAIAQNKKKHPFMPSLINQIFGASWLQQSKMFAMMSNSNIFFMDSFHKDYN
jgi:hypothetical protein